MTKPGLYRHYKGPLYVVLGTVQNSTNDAPVEQEVMVLYYSLERGINNLRVRRETEFHEKVDSGGMMVLRFTPEEVLRVAER